MNRTLALSLGLIATLCAATSADARPLLPSDPFDARVLAAYHCNKSTMDLGYTEARIAKCKLEYDRSLAFEQSAQELTAAQRSTLAVAKSLSMMTVAAGYAKIDGKMTARACQAIRSIDTSLTQYDAAAPNGLEGLHKLLVDTLEVSIPKCRIGGHWPG